METTRNKLCGLASKQLLGLCLDLTTTLDQPTRHHQPTDSGFTQAVLVALYAKPKRWRLTGAVAQAGLIPNLADQVYEGVRETFSFERLEVKSFQAIVVIA